MTELVFLYDSLLRLLTSEIPDAEPGNLRKAKLSGFQLCPAQYGVPVSVQAREGAVDGWLISLASDSVRRITAFHAIFDYEGAVVEVQTADGPEQALVFVAAAETSQSFNISSGAVLSAEHESILARAAAEILMLASSMSIGALRTRWPMALSHAASVERAQRETQPAMQRAPWTREDVAEATQKQPYAWFFGVREDDLRFRKFDGAMGPSVTRAAFVMSDAVTLLPYDPKRDTVMLIEQFRFGPWLRGASNCWLLEPIAGRVDPFETPVDAALREAQEEARLSLNKDQLVSVGDVYPSPGAITEFLYQYVALCDLPDGVEGVAGLEGEAENIRSHVVPFPRLIELIRSGEVQNGPLVLSAYWLDAYRAKNRL
ncbi:MAG: NUDIX domain-containing protein [Roseinatronobacter sp.]